MIENEERARLLLAAQRALLGHVTPNLRRFSVEKDGRTVRTMAVFAQEPTADEVELTQIAGTEIISHWTDAVISETVVVSSARHPPSLMLLAYQRWEAPT